MSDKSTELFKCRISYLKGQFRWPGKLKQGKTRQHTIIIGITVVVVVVVSIQIGLIGGDTSVCRLVCRPIAIGCRSLVRIVHWGLLVVIVVCCWTIILVIRAWPLAVAGGGIRVIRMTTMMLASLWLLMLTGNVDLDDIAVDACAVQLECIDERRLRMKLDITVALELVRVLVSYHAHRLVLDVFEYDVNVSLYEIIWQVANIDDKLLLLLIAVRRWLPRALCSRRMLLLTIVVAELTALIH